MFENGYSLFLATEILNSKNENSIFFEFPDVNSRTPGGSISIWSIISTWIDFELIIYEFSNFLFVENLFFLSRNLVMFQLKLLAGSTSTFDFIKKPSDSSEKYHFCDRMIEIFPGFCYEILLRVYLGMRTCCGFIRRRDMLRKHFFS